MFYHCLSLFWNESSDRSEKTQTSYSQGLQQPLTRLARLNCYRLIAFLLKSFGCRSTTLKLYEVDDIKFLVSQHSSAMKRPLRGRVGLSLRRFPSVENHLTQN